MSAGKTPETGANAGHIAVNGADGAPGLSTIARLTLELAQQREIARKYAELYEQEKQVAAAGKEGLRELREKARLFSTVLQNSSQPFASGYPDGRLLYFNEAFAELTGYSGKELRSATWNVGLTPPEWREHEAKTLEELLRTGQPQTYEKEYIRKDGTRIPIELKVHLARDARGEPEYYYGFISNIAERKRAEAAREALSQQRQVALDAARLGWWTLDPLTKVTTFDRRFAEIFGLQGSQGTSEPILARIHPDDRARVWAKLDAALSPVGPKLFSAEYRLLADDGSTRWVEAHAQATYDGEGADRHPVSLVGTVQDITDRKRTEEELRQRELLLRSITDLSSDMILVKDCESRILFMNPAGLRLAGLPAEAVIGRNDAELPGVPAELAAFMAADRQVIESGRTQTFEEVYTSAVTGREVTLLTTKTPRVDETGQVIGLMGIGRDITDRKQMENELKAAKVSAEQARAAAEEASRAKDHFLAVLSHELRTPLTPVLTTVQMMERDRHVQGEMRDAIAMIRRNIELEARLIDDLLDLTRISRGKLELHVQTIDVHEKIQHVAGICRDGIRGKQLRLTLNLHARQHLVQGDPARLQQILWNLVKNAIKFTPIGGTINITSTDADGRIAVMVEDTGVGIAAEILPRIFDAFEQGGKDVTRLFGGLGLGLSITKGLVDLHGGTIAARSDGHNRGACFTVHLPASVLPEPLLPADPGDSGPQRARMSCRILLVEDHADTRKSTTRLLRSFGYDVNSADSVSSALRLAMAGQFDLIISDIGLPDGSGLDLMRQLCDQKQIKGIAISGYGQEEDIRRSQEAGFAAHVTKPLNVVAFEETIRRVLGDD